MQTFFKKVAVLLTVIALCLFSMTMVVGCQAVPGGDGAPQASTSESENNSSTTIDESSSSEDSSNEDSSIEDSSSDDSSIETSSPEDSSSEDSSNEDSSIEDSSEDSSSTGGEAPPIIEPDYQYKSVYGSVTESEGTLISGMPNTLAINTEEEFVQGTLKATVSLAGTGGDNGIVFGLKNEKNLNAYWEHEGVHYFFFFISNAGTAYLGKVSNQTWTVCGETPIPGYNARGIYTLEVARDKSNTGYDVIRCYVNGELYVSYKDSNHVDGTVYGVRAGKAGIQFSGIEISNEIKGSSVAVEGYVIASGEYEQKGDTLTSLTGNAIAEKTDGEFIYGTLEATMKIGGAADNGLIFSLTPNDTHAYWEADVSYYFFFVSKDGLAFLGKVDNGTWTNCQHVDIPGYTTNKTYTLKIEKDATTIYGYVDGNCLITYADSFPLSGTGYGLRAGGNGVSFSNVKCQSSGEITEIYPEDLTVVSGKMLGTSGAARSADNNTLALIKDASMEEGTLTASIKGVATKRAGLVFSYSNDGTTESYYRFVSRKDAQKVELDMVVNGVASNVYSNYLSAGYNSGKAYDFRVVVENGVAYCYFWNTLYAVVEVELAGTGVGLYAEGPASQFSNYTVSAEPSVTKVDTLLFGHSYFELWANYKNDLAQLAKDYNFGTYLNIGIGGSVASHWAKFKKALVAYDASKAIYMIGINDLTGGTSPASVVASIEESLLYMKEAKPELEVVLLSVNHCPARTNIKANISATNELMRDLVAQYSWLSYAEVEYAFCDNGVDADAYWFTDGLHPTANGYVQKIVPAIKNALEGVGQPEMSDELLQELLLKTKALKAIELYDYREDSYRSAEWTLAKPHYEEAMALIEACESLEAVEELDLSSYITSLKTIKRNTEYVYADMVGNNGCVVWETTTFKNALDSSVNGVYNVEHDGHRVVDNTYYSDMSFTFCLSDLVNEVGTTGILFRAKQLAGLGIEGYMINIVSEPNYIQIWYFNDSFGSSTMFANMTYIGGWVFPGEVEETLFRAVIEGNTCYIYTEADFRAKGKDSYGCSVDLTYNGAFTPWAEGGIGILAWDSGNKAKCTLTIDNISGVITKSSTVTPPVDTDALEKTKEAKKAELNDYSERAYRAADWATAKPVYESAIALIEACETVADVEALDLSSAIADLDSINRHHDHLYSDMVSKTDCDVWEIEILTNALNGSTGGVYTVKGDGHRLVNNTLYSDMSFNFRLSDITADFATVGIMFRATQTPTLGIKGYLINYVTKDNYLQVWYLDNGYGSGTIGTNMTYIGGWVFNGEVEETLFRAVIEGNTCKLYTEEAYKVGGAAGCTVDLTNGGKFVPYTEGGIGINCWAGSAGTTAGKLLIDNLTATVVTKEAVVESDKTQEIVTALKGSESIHSFNSANITGGNNGVFQGKEFGYKLYTSLECSNSTLTVTPSNSNGDLSIAGYLVRCKKNATNNGIDGYLVNFVSNASSQFVQIYYLQNCYNTDGSALICDYIGGWVYPGQVLGTTFEVTVEGDFITVAANGSSVSVSLDGSSVGKSYTVHQNGGFGLISWQEGLTIDLAINKILVR